MTENKMTPIDSIVARLTALHPKRIDLSLDRMQRLLAALGSPERRLPPVIHVAGTNGKGSTIAFMRGMLEAAGQSVHVYISPHLVRFNERIRLAGRLKSRKIDALLITQPDNRRYLSGFKAGDLAITESSGALLVLANALLSALIVLAYALWFAPASAPRLAVLDVGELYRMKETQVAKVLVKLDATHEDRALALQRASAFGLEMTNLIQSLPDECHCLILARGAVALAPAAALPALPAWASAVVPYAEGAAVLGGAYALTRLSRWAVTKLAARFGWEKNTVVLARFISNAVVWTAGVGVGLSVLGVSGTALLATFGAGGTAMALAVTLAVRDVAGNLFHGVHFLLSRPFTVGDKVTIGKTTGVVHDLTLRYLVLKDENGGFILFTYNSIAAAPVKLYGEYQTKEIRLRLSKPAFPRGLLRALPRSGALWLLGFLAITGSPPFGTFVRASTREKSRPRSR